MASTSWVLELRAMTVGSFITMPRPRLMTRVFAVPRSMARSLARPRPPMPSSLPGPYILGGQGSQSPGELLDTGLDRCGPPPAGCHDERHEQHQYQGHRHIQEVGHAITTPAPPTISSSLRHPDDITCVGAPLDTSRPTLT